MKNKLIAFIDKYSLLVFFIATYFISWILWLPLILFGESKVIIFGSFGPTITAMVLTFLLNGTVGIKALLKKFTIWKVRSFWYLFSFLSTAVIVLITIAIFRVLEDKVFIFNDIRQWYLIIVAFVYVFFLSVLGEEIGWRGYALPRLQKRYSALTSSVIIGVIWGLWHLPLFFIKGNFHQSIPIILFLIQAIALSVIYTWIYNNTKGSLLIVHIFHAASNVTLGVLPVLPMDVGNDIRPLWVTVIILVIISITIVLRYGPKNLSNKQRIIYVKPLAKTK